MIANHTQHLIGCILPDVPRLRIRFCRLGGSIEETKRTGFCGRRIAAFTKARLCMKDGPVRELC